MFRGGPIELEQMGSADPPLAVHGFHGGRHHQHRGRGTGEVHRQSGTFGGGQACPAVCHRCVLVPAALCHQVAQCATRLNDGRPTTKGCAADGWLSATLCREIPLSLLVCYRRNTSIELLDADAEWFVISARPILQNA